MKLYRVQEEGLAEDKKQTWICIAICLFLCFPLLNSAIGGIIKLFFAIQFNLGTYAVPFGGSIIVCLCCYAIRSIFAVGKAPMASIVLYGLIASGLMKLTSSGSYLLTEPSFWALIGLILNFCYSKYVKSSERSGKICFTK